MSNQIPEQTYIETLTMVRNRLGTLLDYVAAQHHMGAGKKKDEAWGISGKLLVQAAEMQKRTRLKKIPGGGS